jgi:UDP-GlcNAc:undecaprenyl-phosphate GlcNAc-1-phosphate transferase
MFAVPTAALLVMMLLPPLIGLARRIGLVDMPGGRKQHAGNVPLVGGLAIYGALVASLPLLAAEAARAALLFAILAGLVVASGVLDDACRLSARAKLALQGGIAVLAILCGGPTLAPDAIVFGGLAHGLVCKLASLVVYVGLMNAVNLLDGADGVAGGVGAVCLGGLVLLAAASGAALPVLPLVALGAVLGFLVYNMPMPWRRRPLVFLGDAGSMLIGFALAWFALALSRVAPHVPPAALAWLVGLPVLDMGRVALARIRHGASPFAAGRDHLHHLLLARGSTPLGTALAMAALALGFGAVGIAGALSGMSEASLLTALSVLALIYFALTERMSRATAARRPAPAIVPAPAVVPARLVPARLVAVAASPRPATAERRVPRLGRAA